MPTFSTNSLSIGTNVTRVVPIVGATDTIWMRDYGPRLAYEKKVRYVSDHTYNVTSRTQDNNFPTIFAPFARHPRYVLPLRHGGGNYHLNSLGEGFATTLITSENTTLTAAQIQSLWLQHWGVNTTIVPAFPQSVDATRHIDMWVQILGDRLVFVSDWPSNAGSTQDVICDNRAAAFAAAGWTVVRLPARSLSGTHYTYTNMVVCNDLCLISSYTNATMQQYNAPGPGRVPGRAPRQDRRRDQHRRPGRARGRHALHRDADPRPPRRTRARRRTGPHHLHLRAEVHRGQHAVQRRRPSAAQVDQRRRRIRLVGADRPVARRRRVVAACARRRTNRRRRLVRLDSPRPVHEVRSLARDRRRRPGQHRCRHLRPVRHQRHRLRG